MLHRRRPPPYLRRARRARRSRGRVRRHADAAQRNRPDLRSRTPSRPVSALVRRAGPVAGRAHRPRGVIWRRGNELRAARPSDDVDDIDLDEPSGMASPIRQRRSVAADRGTVHDATTLRCMARRPHHAFSSCSGRNRLPAVHRAVTHPGATRVRWALQLRRTRLRRVRNDRGGHRMASLTRWTAHSPTAGTGRRMHRGEAMVRRNHPRPVPRCVGECTSDIDFSDGSTTSSWTSDTNDTCNATLLGVRNGAWIAHVQPLHGTFGSSYPGPGVLYEISTLGDSRPLTPTTLPSSWNSPGVLANAQIIGG